MAKPRPNRLGMYADLQPILDAALASGGGTYTLDTHGQAVHWRQRAYKFRKLYSATIQANSKYDRLTFPKIPEGSPTVVIKLIEATGRFVPAMTNPQPEPLDTTDDLLEAASLFAKRVGGAE